MKLLLLIFLVPMSLDAGLASWYGPDHAGKLMANGRRFDPAKFTAASWKYPLGAKLRVTTDNGFWVDVEITDRGPNKRLVKQGVVIDLSLAAFEELAGKELGLVKVKIKRLNYGKK